MQFFKNEANFLEAPTFGLTSPSLNLSSQCQSSPASVSVIVCPDAPAVSKNGPQRKGGRTKPQVGVIVQQKTGITDDSSSKNPTLKGSAVTGGRAATKPKKTRERNVTKKTEGGPALKKRVHCSVTQCNYSTPNPKDLTRHMRKHTGERPFNCEKCEKSYSRYDKLYTHMRTHEGHKHFKCEHCDYAASNKETLKKHALTHTLLRPYKCELCSYAARASSQLIVHLRRHVGDNPYTCMAKDCTAAFKTPSDLSRHARTHTGLKPYACHFCEYKAAVKSNLLTHIRRKHQDQDLEELDYGIERGSTTFLDPLLGPQYILSQNDPNLKTEQVQPIPQTLPISTSSDNDAETQARQTPKQVKQSKGQGRPGKQKIEVPYLFGCKLCLFKTDEMKKFENHMKRKHKNFGLLTSIQGVIRKTGQPTETLTGIPASNMKYYPPPNDFPKFYDCSICSVAFVREDSLRCHMKQHVTPTPRLSLNRRLKLISATSIPSHVDHGLLKP